MAKVTITIEDTEPGKASISCEFDPPVDAETEEYTAAQTCASFFVDLAHGLNRGLDCAQVGEIWARGGDCSNYASGGAVN